MIWQDSCSKCNTSRRSQKSKRILLKNSPEIHPSLPRTKSSQLLKPSPFTHQSHSTTKIYLLRQTSRRKFSMLSSFWMRRSSMKFLGKYLQVRWNLSKRRMKIMKMTSKKNPHNYKDRRIRKLRRKRKV